MKEDQKNIAELQEENRKLRQSLSCMEERLKMSDEKFLRLSDATFEAVLLHEDGKILETNVKFQVMFGWSLDDLRNSSEPVFIAPEFRELLMKHFAEKHEEPYEVLGQRKDGSKFHIEIHCKGLNLCGKNLRVVTIRDISKRKKLEEEVKLRALFGKFNPGPVLRCDKDAMLRMVNPAAMEIFGMEKEEGIRLNEFIPGIENIGLEDCIAKDSLTAFSAPVGDQYFQFTVRGVSEMGVAQIYGSDITDRKKLEGRLQETLAELQIILESAGVGISLVKEGKIIWANNILEEIFRGSRESVYGKDLSIFFSSQSAKEEELKGASLIAGEPVQIEGTLKRLDSSLFWSRVVGKAIDPADLSKGIIYIIEDFSQRKEMEEKLKQALAELEIILENAGVGIAMVMARKFSWMNKKLREMLGYEKAEVEDLGIEALFPKKVTEEEFHKIHAGNMEKMKQGETIYMETNIKRKDGSLFWGRRVIKAIDSSNLSMGLISIVEDFSERKRMEEELRAAKEKAEEATKLKDKFVSLVAHDLKSPFNSILGYLTLVHDDAQNPLHPKHHEMLSRAMDSGKALLHMIEELLKISRFQTGKILLQPKFFDGYLSAGYAAANLRNLAEQKGISLISEVPRGTRLYADVNLFGEVVQNLVSNAVKFCHEGDRITISALKGRAGITVNDTGVGINEMMLPKIFQHEETTSTKGTAGEKGTGLGLPFSHDIMEAHGGTLRVESVAGKGSTFYAELPTVKPVILLVDDDEVTRFMFKENMLQHDLEILEAENGEEAMRLMDKTIPHLILTDIEMPVMNGYEFLKRIKEKEETKSTPVIVITSSSSIEDREKAFQLGANDYVGKPLVIEDLIPRVRRFVS